ncbi:MAG: helix-turn-helix transcriptional regulator [Clostridia bacterium]
MKPNPFKNLRKAKGFSQKELGEIMHISQTSISQWETGRTLPDYKTLIAIADMYGVSTDYLLGRTDNPLSIVPRETPYVEVDPFEKQLLEVYRALPFAEQTVVCRSLGLLHPAAMRDKIKQA